MGFSSKNELAIQGNAFLCYDTVTNTTSNYSTSNFTQSSNPSFCVSDFGDVEISPTLQVSKHWNGIKEDSLGNYYTDQKSNSCVWTWVGGTANIPYMDFGSNISKGKWADGLKAFCWANNSLNIYSFNQK